MGNDNSKQKPKEEHKMQSEASNEVSSEPNDNEKEMKLKSGDIEIEKSTEETTGNMDESKNKKPTSEDIAAEDLPAFKEEIKEEGETQEMDKSEEKKESSQPKEKPKVNKSSLMADVLMFFGSLALIILYASYKDPRKQEDPVKLVRSKNRKTFVPAPEEEIDYSMNPDCGAVLSLSSIPDKGYGIFAIKVFNKNEIMSDFNLPLNSAGIEDNTIKSIFGGSQITFGTSLQSHPYLQNVALGSLITAQNDISPGHELFVSRDEENEKELFDTANDIIKDMMGLIKRSPSQYGKQKDNKVVQESALKIIKSTVKRFDSTIASLLPTTIEELSKVSLAGSAYNSVHNKTHLQLRSHGKCIDKISQKPSTEEKAAFGAFAQRDIEKGELIIPALLSVIDKSELQYNTQKGPTYHSAANYCFAHPESSVLLCHVTSAALINHKSCSTESTTNTCAACPNAQYKWSEWNLKNTYSHKESPPLLYEKFGRNMVTIDIFATRDIKAGEEIFYDYGEEWKNAWEAYSSEGHEAFIHPIGIKDELIPIAWKNRD